MELPHVGQDCHKCNPNQKRTIEPAKEQTSGQPAGDRYLFLKKNDKRNKWDLVDGKRGGVNGGKCDREHR